MKPSKHEDGARTGKMRGNWMGNRCAGTYPGRLSSHLNEHPPRHSLYAGNHIATHNTHCPLMVTQNTTGIPSCHQGAFLLAASCYPVGPIYPWERTSTTECGSRQGDQATTSTCQRCRKTGSELRRASLSSKLWSVTGLFFFPLLTDGAGILRDFSKPGLLL